MILNICTWRIWAEKMRKTVSRTMWWLSRWSLEMAFLRQLYGTQPCSATKCREISPESTNITIPQLVSMMLFSKTIVIAKINSNEQFVMVFCNSKKCFLRQVFFGTVTIQISTETKVLYETLYYWSFKQSYGPSTFIIIKWFVESVWSR